MASLSIENLTLQGGFVTGTTARGGAILNQGELALTGVTVQNNRASGGTQFGGIGPTRGFNAVGGGIYSIGVLSLTDCDIRNNQAVGGNGRSPGGGYGGGLFIAGESADLSDAPGCRQHRAGRQRVVGRSMSGRTSSVGPGSAGIGGGLYVSAGSVDLLDVALTGNWPKAAPASGQTRSRSGGDGGSGLGGGMYVAAGCAPTCTTVSPPTTRQPEAMGVPADLRAIAARVRAAESISLRMLVRPLTSSPSATSSKTKHPPATETSPDRTHCASRDSRRPDRSHSIAGGQPDDVQLIDRQVQRGSARRSACAPADDESFPLTSHI